MLQETVARAVSDSSQGLIDDYANKRIDYRLVRLTKKFCLNVQDIEDLRQDFLLALVKAGQRFDPAKCKRKTYIQAVLDRRYQHHVRQLSVKNQQPAFNPTPLDDMDPDIDEKLPDPTGERDLQLAALAMDTESILSQMPPKLRRVCQALMEAANPQQAAKQLGIDPGTVSRLIQRIRPYFVRAGYEFGV